MAEKWYVIDNNDIGPEGDPARLGEFENQAAAELFKADYEVRNPGEWVEVISGTELLRQAVANVSEIETA